MSVLKTALIVSGTTLLFAAGTNAAENKSGYYAGFGLSSFDMKQDILPSWWEGALDQDLKDQYTVNNFNTTSDGRGFVFNGGYRFNNYIAFNLDVAHKRMDSTADLYRPETNEHYRGSFDVDTIYITPGVHLLYPVSQNIDVYAKLGVSIILSEWDADSNISGPNYDYTEIITETEHEGGSDWQIAPTFGIGAEWKFGQNWAAHAEYSYTESTVELFEEDDGTSKVDFEDNTFVIGLRYHF
ncbi:opacity protein-like surface antigen [Sinobacterium caligoides]|uniref:Opacity protein-like surface antigen n=1 Tax=Sinobacterium caligoides TaxID=933926 RepID=A0A3N2DPN3_9GAMM|nr:outer membrane beta-barrel protein [Sinobacterium caligoides]ROS01756.1 opacity protein-like surface antigen [Sinobacterium caligoides]